MPNQQLLGYIKQRLGEGESKESITVALTSRGWKKQDIDEAFSAVVGQDSLTQPPAAQESPTTQPLGSAGAGAGMSDSPNQPPSQSEIAGQPAVAGQPNQGAQTVGGSAAKNGKATAGLVLGIIGLAAWYIPIIGAPVVIIGLVLSINGLKSLKHTNAVIGVFLCSLGLLATIVNASIGAYQGARGENPAVNKILSSKEEKTKKTDNTVLDNSLTKNNGSSKQDLVEQTVQTIKSNTTLPYQLNQATTLVDVTAEPDAIRYHYVLSGLNLDTLTAEGLKDNLLKSACSDSDILKFLGQGVNMEYSYSAKNSDKKFFVTISKSDCR